MLHLLADDTGGFPIWGIVVAIFFIIVLLRLLVIACLRCLLPDRYQLWSNAQRYVTQKFV